MHRVLKIPEILRLVLEQLPREHLLKTTLVSRLLWNATVPLLWEEPPFWPFEGLSANLDESSQKQALKRLCDVYAPHVKSFKLVLGFEEDRLFGVLRSEGRSRIFPKLNRLEIRVSDLSELDDFAHCVVGPTIRHLHAVLRAPLADVETSVQRLAAMIRDASLTLEGLSIKAENDVILGSAVEQELTQTIEAIPSLRRLDIPGINFLKGSVVVALSKLPDLRQTSFIHLIVPPTSVTPERSFPSLVKLVAEVSVASISPLLSSISSTAVKEITLSMARTGGQRTLSPGCFAAAQHFPSLKVVDLHMHSTLRSWNDLLPFLSCPSMQRFRVECRAVATLIDNDRLKSLAQAWPDLQELTFEDNFRHSEEPNDAPSVSLQGLTCLAKYCPALQKLKITVDARDLPNGTTPDAVGKEVEHVHLEYSLADEREDRIAFFISKMWPNLQRDLHTSHKVNNNAASQHARWRRIEGKVTGLNLGLYFVISSMNSSISRGSRSYY